VVVANDEIDASGWWRSHLFHFSGLDAAIERHNEGEAIGIAKSMAFGKCRSPW
jgi:hypothetical protein